jgi:glutathionylspermidine synthase
LITQSKALFAVIYELIGKGFFSAEDEKFILEYIPYTCLEIDNKISSDFVIKPYLSREGSGIELSCDEKLQGEEDVIFQDRVNIRPLYTKVYSTIKEESKYQFPVIGLYITGDKPSGIFTRMGDFITDKNAIYMSTYIK